MKTRPPASTSDSIDPRVVEEAAAWLARRDAGFTAGEEARFHAWLESDPRHAEAARKLGLAWSVLLHPRASGREKNVLHELAERRARRVRRRVVAGVAFTALAAAAMLLLLLPRFGFRSGTSHAANIVAVAEPRPEHRVLSDSPMVDLRAGATIAVEFTAGKRAVRLLRGQAIFAVKKDAARPFIVSAGGIKVRAVGTEFAVALGARDVDVLVTEGKVRVTRAPSPEASVRTDGVALVEAGYRLVLHETTGEIRQRPEMVSAAEIARALAWRGGRVEFSATPLADAIRTFNRQNRLQLALEDPAIGQLEISGVFRADDPAGFSRLIETTFDLKAVRTADNRIVLAR